MKVIKYKNREIIDLFHGETPMFRTYSGETIMIGKEPTREIAVFTKDMIPSQTIKPNIAPATVGDWFVIKAASETEADRYICSNTSGQLVGAVIQDADNINNYAWTLEETSVENQYYIVNKSGYYWKYSGRSTSAMPLTKDKSEACKVKLGKGPDNLGMDDNYVFQEMESGGKYGLNNLYMRNTIYNWWTTEDVFTYNNPDRSGYFLLYKLN